MAQLQERRSSTSASAAEGAVSPTSEGESKLESSEDGRPPGLFQIHKTFDAFRIPAYRILWGSTICSLLGMQMQMVGKGLLAYELGGTNSAIAFIGLAWGLPMAVFSLVGGTVADRLSRRKVMMVSQSCTATIAIAIAFLITTDVITLPLLFAFGLIQGTVFSFGGPARQAFIPEVVGEKQLMNAIALNQAGMNLTRIIGPAVAGILVGISFIDLRGVFFTQAIMNALSLILLAAMPLFMRKGKHDPETAAEATEAAEANAAPEHRRKPRGSIGFELVNGLRYIISSPILLTLLVMGLVPSLIGMNYQTFLPVFAKEVFGDGVTRNAQALGLMMTMTGVGALVGSLVVASMADYPRRTQLQLFAGLGFGLSLAFFAVQNSFGLALVGLTAVGFSATFFQALNSTMIMSSSHPDYYGRVMSVNMMTFALMPLGGLPIGLLADIIPPMTLGPLTLIGLQTTQLGAGLLVAVFILVVTLRNPAYRKLEQDDFKRFAVIASERLEADGAHGSSWKQLGRAIRQERGSQVVSKMSRDADVTRGD